MDCFSDSDANADLVHEAPAAVPGRRSVGAACSSFARVQSVVWDTSLARDALLQVDGAGSAKDRLAAGSATCFSSLGPAQFVQNVAEWNQWKGSIDAVVADVAADPGKWNMAELMEVGLLIGESHADAEVARGIADQALQTAATECKAGNDCW